MRISELDEVVARLDQSSDPRVFTSNDFDVSEYYEPSDVHLKVREAKDYLAEIVDDIINPKIEKLSTMPWQKTVKTFHFRMGEVTLYAGGNGGGKSMITGQIALGLIKQNQKICIASFEMKPKRTLYRMMRQFSGEDIGLPRLSGKDIYIGNIAKRFSTFAKNNLYLYDQQGTTSAKQVIAMARYCAVKLGVNHIFIDSLMKCVSGEDDYNAQKAFVDAITALARDHDVHIHLIHHIRKLQNEETMPNKNDIKGSGSISDQVDNVLLMFRNKKKEHDAQQGKSVDDRIPDAMLMCEKQRNGESEEWYNLWFHNDSQQFVEAYDGIPMGFDAGGNF
jgi:twinkle protein